MHEHDGVLNTNPLRRRFLFGLFGFVSVEGVAAKFKPAASPVFRREPVPERLRTRDPRLTVSGVVSQLLAITLLALPLLDYAVIGASGFKRDPTDQPFRRAPMAESPRSIVIPLATNLHWAFDAQLLRTHTVWSGPGLNLRGPPYTAEKNPFLCDFSGTVLWSNSPVFPWSAGGAADKDLCRRPEGDRFIGIDTKQGRVTLTYEWTPPRTKSVRVQESGGILRVGEMNVVVRRLETGPCVEPVRYLAHAEPASGPVSRIGAADMAHERNGDVLFVGARSKAAVEWEFLDQPVDYQHDVVGENNLDSEIGRRHEKGKEARFYLKIPAHTTDITIEIFSAVCRTKAEADQVEQTLPPGLATPHPFKAEAGPTKDTAPQTAREFGGDPMFRRPTSGDEFYHIEHFPVPREIDLLVGGMDWLPNGDLAVCTWPGEVYIVQNAQGPATQAKYRRFARGLNEPLGLKVVQERIYVAQKCELTRLTDTDGDGEADFYETLNDDWGFSGNYHSFAFGPLADKANNFYILLAGQRGRWEVPYVGWCLKMGPTGGKLEGFCSGLRAPNGWATFGPNQDLFVTDNQGEWVGTCKLNHLQRGKFYGFPSGYPAPEAEYSLPKTFEPPAVWFPRKLSPSASGIAVITDERFGPFQGQMLVGDFQNGLVMRVALERVNGQWQGAVWPFVKGFLGAVNRLTMGPDGKLYVGGCKRAWSTAAPMEYSLERVSFTGKSPFEVKEVHAQPDGLELTFTQPVETTAATNVENYAVSQFGYRYWASYGSPEIDQEDKENSSTQIDVAQVRVSSDRLKVTLSLRGWRAGYVTAVRMVDVTSAAGESLWHDTFYYSLIRIPD